MFIEYSRKVELIVDQSIKSTFVHWIFKEAYMNADYNIKSTWVHWIFKEGRSDLTASHNCKIHLFLEYSRKANLTAQGPITVTDHNTQFKSQLLSPIIIHNFHLHLQMIISYSSPNYSDRPFIYYLSPIYNGWS